LLDGQHQVMRSLHSSRGDRRLPAPEPILECLDCLLQSGRDPFPVQEPQFLNLAEQFIALGQQPAASQVGRFTQEVGESRHAGREG
jgi:hypothetical protein